MNSKVMIAFITEPETRPGDQSLVIHQHLLTRCSLISLRLCIFIYKSRIKKKTKQKNKALFNAKVFHYHANKHGLIGVLIYVVTFLT